MTPSKLPRPAATAVAVTERPGNPTRRIERRPSAYLIINPRVARQFAAIDRLTARGALPDADDPRYDGVLQREIEQIINEEQQTKTTATQGLETA